MSTYTSQRPGRPLVLFVAAALIPLVAFAVVTTLLSLKEQRAVLEEGALAQARRISVLVDTELKGQLEVLEALAQSPDLDEPPDFGRFAEALRREQRTNPLWIAGILSGVDGNVLIHTLLPLPRRVVDIESLQRAVHDGKPTVGPLLMGQAGPGLALRAPVIRDGVARLVVTAGLRPAGVRDVLLAAGLPPEWLGIVIDRTEHVVACTQAKERFVGGLANPFARAASEHATSGIYEGRVSDGVPTVSVFYVSPKTGWSVHIGIPRTVFDAPLVKGRWIAIGGGTSCLILTGTFLYLMAREVRRRRAASEAFEQAQRIEGLGRLTGGVAHDFNNLLTIILGNADVLERRFAEARDSAPLRAIRAAAERGANLTRSLLVFSRGGTGERSTFDVNACLRNMRGMLLETAGARITVDLEFQPGLPLVSIDRLEFELALLNLASNARDAMPDGGRMLVATGAAELPGGKRGILVLVADTGAGMPPHIQKRAFEPFFTTKEIGHGTGLGLWQVFGLARATGGDVRIESRPGAGTRVSLLLPEAPVEAKAAVRAEPPVSTARLDGRCVLLVDDNVQVREVMAANLQAEGYKVREAGDAGAALTLLENHPEAFDVVVSDIVMPGPFDGLALARTVAQRWPGLPVVLVSGYAKTLAQAQIEGLQVLMKPVTAAALAETVARAVGSGAKARLAR